MGPLEMGVARWMSPRGKIKSNEQRKATNDNTRQTTLDNADRRNNHESEKEREREREIKKKIYQHRRVTREGKRKQTNSCPKSEPETSQQTRTSTPVEERGYYDAENHATRRTYLKGRIKRIRRERAHNERRKGAKNNATKGPNERKSRDANPALGSAAFSRGTR